MVQRGQKGGEERCGISCISMICATKPSASDRRFIFLSKGGYICIKGKEYSIETTE